MFDLIAFDADDTLWHHETLFHLTQESFAALVAPYLLRPWSGAELYATELRNLQHFGYGVKGFILSMIETAIEVSGGSVPAAVIQQIVDLGRAMLAAPVELLDGVAEVIAELGRSYPLLLITKGDLFDQEAKVARSGLADRFRHIEIVSDKTPATYAAILARHGVAPERFLMVGNSLRSDIVPVVALGGRAIYIPYQLTWAHEHVEREALPPGIVELERIALLPAWLAAQARP